MAATRSRGRRPECLLRPLFELLVEPVLFAVIGGLLLDLDQGSQLVNFGACLGFMSVNLSVLVHYFVRQQQRGGSAFWVNLVCPLLGFAICSYIWLSVSPLAMRVGGLWTLAGVLYLAIQAVTLRSKPGE